MIVNRVHRDGLAGRTPDEIAEALAPRLGERLAHRVATNARDFEILVRRDELAVARLSEELGDPDPIIVGHLDHDVYDLAALTEVETQLFAPAARREPPS